MQHSNLVRTSAASILLATIATAQVNIRPSQIVDTTNTGFGILPSVASDGDLSAVIYTDGGSTGADRIYCVTSDGRGLTWGTPVLVDTNGVNAVTALTQFDSCKIFGNTIYAIWEDSRGGALKMYFNSSTDGGATFGSEIEIPSPYTGNGTNPVRDWRFVAPNPVDLYVLVTMDNGDEELYLMASHDSGATWNTVQVNSTADDVDQIGIDVDPAAPLTVHIAWNDDRAGSTSQDDVFYRKSTDGGATFTGTEIQVDASGPLSGDSEVAVEIEADGPQVAIAWLEEVASTTNEEVRFALSNDGGTTFAPDVLVGNYTAGTNDVDGLALGSLFGTFFLAWDDNRNTTSDEVFVTTAPGGVLSGVDTIVGSTGAGFPRLITDTVNGTVAISCTADGSVSAGDDVPQVSWSEDFGATWNGPFTTTDQDQSVVDADFSELAYNPLYNNFINVWLSDVGNPIGANTTNRVTVGGFRPQTVTGIGWTAINDAASTALQWNASNFGVDAVCFVLLSVGNGPTPLGDGRVVDLDPDFLPLIGDPLLTIFLAGGSGNGIAAPNPFAGLPTTGPTVTLFYAGVGFTSGPGRVSDTFSFDFTVP